MAEAKRLPRGRHDLSREQVEETQRLRILVGMAEAMADSGYANTPVAAVIRRAGVSREPYYQLFAGKLDGFLAAFDLVSDVIVAEMAAAVDGRDSCGPRGGDRTSRGGQRKIADLLADLLADELGARSEAARFSCEMIVAAVASMLTAPLVLDDRDAILALGSRVSAHFHQLHAAGLFELCG